MKSLFALVLLLLLAGCRAGTYQRVPVPPQDVQISSSSVSRIYLLRMPEAKGYYRSVTVTDNSKEVGRIGNDSYLCWERSPERTLLALEVEPVEMVGGKATELLVDVPCEPGKVYYYAISVDASWNKPKVSQLEESEARELLKGLSLPPKD
jgi:hypothetical protein